MKTSVKVLALLSALVVVFSAVGVYATWQYTENEVFPATATLSIVPFPWSGSEILPDGEGFNHAWLINNLLNGKDANGNGIGLNTTNSELNQEIADRWKSGFLDPRRDTIGSMATWFGGTLDAMFGSEAANLEFLIKFIDENGDGQIDYYYIYTVGLRFSDSDPQYGLWGSPNIPYGNKIYPIYRTKIVKDQYDQWAAESSALGFANSALYDASSSLGFIASIPSFDEDTWKPVNADGTNMPGQSMDDPLWTYADLENSIEVGTKTTVVYYAFSPLATNTYTVTAAEGSDCRFVVYDGNQNEIARSGSGDTSVSFNGAYSNNNRRTYYIAVSGDTELTFTVTQANG
jgi:hypothetical protein